MAEKKHSMTPDEALARMEGELETMRAEPETEQFEGISASDAIEIGYEMAIRDYKRFTSPPTFEMAAVVVGIPVHDEGEPEHD